MTKTLDNPPAWAMDAVANAPGLMTKHEVAKLLRRSTRSIDRAVARGELQTIPGGRGPVFARLAVAAFLARSAARASA